MVVTFCGHGEMTYSEETQRILYNILEELIDRGANEFLLGGYGRFDMLAARTVKTLKEKYPQIVSALIIPYMDHDFDVSLYDCSEYPPIENTPPRFAILKRNEWMVRKADVVVAYVAYDWGGAAKTLEYAERRKKRIINIALISENRVGD